MPNNDEIIAIQIKKDNLTIKYTDVEMLKTIITQLLQAKETRILTVHDFPPVNGYYTINIITEDNSRFYKYFIYQENSKWYIEQPYRGVYKLNEYT